MRAEHWAGWLHANRYYPRYHSHLFINMSTARERIEAEALALPSSERAALAYRLIVSLDENGEDDPTEVELAWAEESQRRLDEYRRGEVEMIPASEVFAKARAAQVRDFGVSHDA